MANENSPIYDALVSESGNPVASVPVDRSYRAILKMAAETPAGIASVPAPASEPKPMAAHRAAG